MFPKFCKVSVALVGEVVGLGWRSPLWVRAGSSLGVVKWVSTSHLIGSQVRGRWLQWVAKWVPAISTMGSQAAIKVVKWAKLCLQWVVKPPLK
jgi:hypothetical protein